MAKEFTLYVENLPSDIVDDEVLVVFATYGEVVNARVFCPLSNWQAGARTALVTYKEQQAAEDAIAVLHGQYKIRVDANHPISVHWKSSDSTPDSSSPDSSHSPADSASADLLQRLFSQEDSCKDVTIVLDDGSISAHKCVLQTASEAFAAILRNGAEQASGTLTIAGTDLRTMRVFLRLIYTGLIDEHDWEGDEGSELPLDILLRVVALAKRYMVMAVLSMTTQVLNKMLEEAVSEAPEDSAVELFEKILAFAIQEDVRPVLFRGCELAKGFHALKAAHQRKQLRPEVSYELEAIWPTPQVVAKRRRLL